MDVLTQKSVKVFDRFLTLKHGECPDQGQDQGQEKGIFQGWVGHVDIESLRFKVHGFTSFPGSIP
jgi:hypothetical protein